MCLIFVSIHSDTSNSNQYRTHYVSKKFQLKDFHQLLVRKTSQIQTLVTSVLCGRCLFCGLFSSFLACPNIFWYISFSLCSSRLCLIINLAKSCWIVLLSGSKVAAFCSKAMAPLVSPLASRIWGEYRNQYKFNEAVN